MENFHCKPDSDNNVKSVGFAPPSRENPYTLTRDESGHWYAIPKSEIVNFNLWVEDTENSNVSEFDFNNYRINSPYHIKIYDFEP